jgi:hypothetical protein
MRDRIIWNVPLPGVHPAGIIVHGEHYSFSEQPAHFTEVARNRDASLSLRLVLVFI